MNRYFIKIGDGIFDSVFDGFYDLDELRKEHPEIYNKYMFDFYNIGKYNDITISYDYEHINFFMLETEYLKEDLNKIIDLEDVFHSSILDIFNLLGETWDIIRNEEGKIR